MRNLLVFSLLTVLPTLVFAIDDPYVPGAEGWKNTNIARKKNAAIYSMAPDSWNVLPETSDTDETDKIYVKNHKSPQLVSKNTRSPLDVWLGGMLKLEQVSKRSLLVSASNIPQKKLFQLSVSFSASRVMTLTPQEFKTLQKPIYRLRASSLLDEKFLAKKMTLIMSDLVATGQRRIATRDEALAMHYYFYWYIVENSAQPQQITKSE